MERFSALEPLYLSETEMSVDLRVDDVTLEDYASVIHLEVSNEVGISEFKIRLALREPEDDDATYNDSGSDGGALSIGAIIGIVVAVVLVVIVVAVAIVWYCKTKQLFCFAQSG